MIDTLFAQQYKLHGRGFARGTFGEAIKATHTLTGRVDVIKKIKMTEEQRKDPNPKKSIPEIDNLYDLHHKNIVTLYSHWHD